MPWLPLYILDSDIDLLNDWLNKDEEVFFIQQVDGSHWKLVKELDIKEAGSSRLWHLRSGGIPVIKQRSPSQGVTIGSVLTKANYVYVDNPFEPWPGRPSSNKQFPFFEDEETKEFSLEVFNAPNTNGEIRISSFGWLGNRYSVFGKGADETTKKWWKHLRYFVGKNSVQVPRGYDLSRKKEIYAFPKAFDAIKSGRVCSTW